MWDLDNIMENHMEIAIFGNEHFASSLKTANALR